MSEDEGTNASAQGVPSEDEDRPDDGETTDAESEETPTESTPDPIASDEDVQQLLDDLTEYDDDLAQRVDSIVEDATETVAQQRAELEDLTERVETQAETIDDLQADLETAEEEVEDLKGRLQRKQADFQNYKKRAKKRQQQIKDRATEDLVEQLIGVRDNMNRALEEESDDVDSLREGLEMTLREFDRVLEDENVSEVDPEPGTEVDPQRHEVMMQVDSDQPEGTIADVYTSGYEMGEKVIQTAQVTVSNGELEDDADEADTE